MVNLYKDAKGFTAAEIMVVIAIGAILSAIALPNYIAWQAKTKLRGSAINLTADLEWARIRAMRENAIVVIQFSATGYEIFIDDGRSGGIAGDWVRSGGEMLLKQKSLPAGVSINMGELNLVDSRVRFNGRGVSPDIAGEGTIPLANRTGQKVVYLNRLGMITNQ